MEQADHSTDLSACGRVFYSTARMVVPIQTSLILIGKCINLCLMDTNPPVTGQSGNLVRNYQVGGGREAITGRKRELTGFWESAAIHSGLRTQTKHKNESGIRMAAKRSNVADVSAAQRIASKHKTTIHLRVQVSITDAALRSCKYDSHP